MTYTCRYCNAEVMLTCDCDKDVELWEEDVRLKRRKEEKDARN